MNACHRYICRGGVVHRGSYPGITSAILTPSFDMYRELPRVQRFSASLSL
jgi:hypothetical protein